MKECIEYFDSLIFKKLPVQVAIAGGALRDYFSGIRADGFNDIDIYVDSKKKLSTVERFLDRNAIRKHDTDYATRYIYNDLNLDLIHGSIYKDLENIIEKFDFTVCCCAIDNTRVVSHSNFFEDLKAKRLMINENAIDILKKNLSILNRFQKYVAKGYMAPDDTILVLAQIIKGISKKDLKIKNKGYSSNIYNQMINNANIILEETPRPRQRFRAHVDREEEHIGWNVVPFPEGNAIVPVEQQEEVFHGNNALLDEIFNENARDMQEEIRHNEQNNEEQIAQF